MAVHYRTQAFILGKRDIGEADRFYLVFTKDFGRLEIFAKGARKIKAKLRSPMELFNLAEIEFVQGRQYKTLTDALLIESFSGIKKDLEKLKAAFQISKLSAKLLRGEQKDEALWQLLEETFQKLNNYELRITSYELLYYFFLWNFLSLLGYQPQVQRCLLCQKKISGPKNFWSSQEGGVICPSCQGRVKEKREVSLNTLKLLKLILQKNHQLLRRLKLEAKDLKDLENLSDDYLAFITSQT